MSTTDRPTLKSEAVPDEPLGQMLGRYKLLEKIGEGGFGVVYVAEQREPVKRRVALKIIKLGMDTRQVVARFEAERQALALMDHPNIAKVLDAGATESGRPYFVMELVRGVKLTDYCDQNKLSTKQRLELFIPVCQAIQHAHQKGIIHRDIKPSNILVTLHDGVPVPKVIDFGIAKATQQDLTDKTIYTQLQQFVGTPAYMSPEQAEMSGLDVDTRSDIYSLGVLLYELLTGRTPFDPKQLMSEGIDAMRKTIREKEPLRPSTKVATLQGEDLSTTAARHAIDAPKLISLLRGDLDWIVMKCLEKDRTRRYETANGLAFDLKRHLNNEPVLARPPSSSYRIQKLVRRNKTVVVAGIAVVLALFGGTVVSVWQAVNATQAKKGALAAEALALQSRNDAEKLSNFVLDDFYTTLEPSGQYDTVARLARQAVAYFDGLSGALRTADTARNQAMAQARLALITARQGNERDALPLADKALGTLERMRQQGDQSEPVNFALALTQEARFLSLFDFSAQTNALQQGIQTLRPQALATDGSPRVKLQYANLLNYFSHVLPSEKAVTTCEEALRILEGLGAMSTNLSAASAWADVADSEAGECLAANRLDQAEHLEKQVQSVAEGVLVQRPGDLRARFDLCWHPQRLTVIEARRFRDDAALQSATQSVQAAQNYIQFNPSDKQGWEAMSGAVFYSPALLLRDGRVAEGLRQARDAMQVDHDPRNSLGAAALYLGPLIAWWEAQRGNNAAAEEALQETRRSWITIDNRKPVSGTTANRHSESFAVRERHVRLALGEDTEVYRAATNALPLLNRLPREGKVISIPERQTLADAAVAALHLEHYADAELAARQWLLLPFETSENHERFQLDQPDDAHWGQVLLAQALLGEARLDEALKDIQPAITAYRAMQAQGATYVTFRQHFARALYIQAVAEVGDDGGKALARDSVDQAAAQLNALTDEAKQLRDSKELFSWILAERNKMGTPQP